MNSNKTLVAGIIAITVLIFAGLLWAVLRAPQDQDGRKIVEEQGLTFDDAKSPVKGPSDANVVVHLVEDLQCPACKAANAPLNGAMQKYADRVRFVWKDFPLERIHKNARLAANAGRCAQDQGKFWEFQERAYQEQDVWKESDDAQATFVTIARELGLDTDRFSSCVASRVHDAEVQADVAEGNANKVDRTPTVFVNNRRYFFMTSAQWDEAIGQALASK